MDTAAWFLNAVGACARACACDCSNAKFQWMGADQRFTLLPRCTSLLPRYTFCSLSACASCYKALSCMRVNVHPCLLVMLG